MFHQAIDSYAQGKLEEGDNILTGGTGFNNSSDGLFLSLAVDPGKETAYAFMAGIGRLRAQLEADE
jgi:hypothetical protein